VTPWCESGRACGCKGAVKVTFTALSRPDPPSLSFEIIALVG
jgi:hypothetical protein